MSADEWVALASSDEPIACHITIPEDGGGSWESEGLRQCQGAAIFRRNICKRPRDESDAAINAVADRDTVFSNRAEFSAHHDRA